MFKFPDLTKLPYTNLALKTRPKLSLEEETKVCGVDEGDILMAWADLDRNLGRNYHEAACDRYIKLASVSISEAAIELGRPSSQMLPLARQGRIPVFKHRERWRIWKAHLREMEKDKPA